GVLSYTALQVLRSGQYPPPGMRVIRDTRLRMGSRAIVLAQVGLVLAAVILLCGLGASVLLMRVSQDPRLQYPGPVREAVGGARLSGSLPYTPTSRPHLRSSRASPGAAQPQPRG